MIQKIKSNERSLEPLNIPDVSVQACDPALAADQSLSAGFSEYMAPCSFEWTFDYQEVFFMLEGSLSLTLEGNAPVLYEAGDLGYIEKGSKTVITVTDRAYFLHVTQPAWQE